MEGEVGGVVDISDGLVDCYQFSPIVGSGGPLPPWVDSVAHSSNRDEDCCPYFIGWGVNDDYAIDSAAIRGVVFVGKVGVGSGGRLDKSGVLVEQKLVASVFRVAVAGTSVGGVIGCIPVTCKYEVLEGIVVNNGVDV